MKVRLAPGTWLVSATKRGYEICNNESSACDFPDMDSALNALESIQSQASYPKAEIVDDFI